MNGNGRAITGFTMIAHAAFHVYGLAIPLFIVVWLNAFDVTPTVIGTVVGVAYGAIGVGALVSGTLSDAYGSKLLVLLSLFGMEPGFLAVGIAPSIELVAIGLVTWGVGASLYHPAGLSLLTRGTDDRGTALGYHGAAGNVGTALGPFAAAFLLTFFHWRSVAMAFVAPAVVRILLGLRLKFDEGTSTRDSEGKSVSSLGEFLTASRGLFTSAFVIAFAVMIPHGIYSRGIFSFLPEILSDLPIFVPVELAGESFDPSQYVYGGLLFAGTFGQYADGKWTTNENVERGVLAAYGAIVLLSVLFLPAAASGVAPLLVVCVLIGFTVYMTAPIRQVLVAKYTAADAHGLSFGYTYLGVFGFGALGATLGGIALTHGDTTAFFSLFGGVAAVTVTLGAYLHHRETTRASD